MNPMMIKQPDAFAACSAAAEAGNHGVLAAVATGLSEFIHTRGSDVDRIFGISGIDPERLTSPTLSLWLVNCCRVLEEAARHSGFDNFGLHYGRQFKPQSLGLIGSLVSVRSRWNRRCIMWLMRFRGISMTP